MNFSYARLLSFAAALIGMVSVYVFMKRTYTGTAIRAIAQDRQIMALMGVDTRRIYLITSALGGSLAGLAACLLSAMAQEGRRVSAAEVAQALRASAVGFRGETVLDQGAGVPHLEAAYRWLLGGHQGSAYEVGAEKVPSPLPSAT